MRVISFPPLLMSDLPILSNDCGGFTALGVQWRFSEKARLIQRIEGGSIKLHSFDHIGEFYDFVLNIGLEQALKESEKGFDDPLDEDYFVPIGGYRYEPSESRHTIVHPRNESHNLEFGSRNGFYECLVMVRLLEIMDSKAASYAKNITLPYINPDD